jgi:hypothetical protein
LRATGLPISVRYTRLLNPASGSRSASSAIRFLLRTRVRRLGMLDDRFGWMFEMRFCARNNVRRRGCSGKLPSCAISLSVRSMASLSCCRRQPLMSILYMNRMRLHVRRPCSQSQRSCGLEVTHIDINSAPKCSICSFQRTSQIEFTLRETVDEGQGIVDHIRGQPHVCDMAAVRLKFRFRTLGTLHGWV